MSAPFGYPDGAGIFILRFNAGIGATAHPGARQRGTAQRRLLGLCGMAFTSLSSKDGACRPLLAHRTGTGGQIDHRRTGSLTTAGLARMAHNRDGAAVTFSITF